MTTLKVKKIDESTLYFNSDVKEILFEINEYYSFMSPGAKFDKRVINHIWDGKIRLANIRKQTIPLGLYNNLKEFCKTRNYNFIDETPEFFKTIKENTDLFDEWIEKIPLKFEPRDYQYNAVKFGIENNRAILLSPTGSGKSLIIYLLMRWHFKEDRRIVIIVPTTSLVEQMISDFKDYACNDDFDIDTIIKPLYGKKKCDTFTEKIVIATWQSLINFDSSLFETWDCVITDETHRAAAKSLQKIVNGAKFAPFKYGLTGSLDGTTVNHFVLMGTFGDVYQVTTTSLLQDKGQLSDLQIYMISLRYDENESKAFFRAHGHDYSSEVDYLIKHPVRQKFICNLALSCKGTTVIFFNLIEQGKSLYNMIKERGETRSVFYVDGGTSTEERESIRETVIKNNDAILIMSVGTSSTGINIPSIENIILHNSKSRIRNLQSIGRGLRLSENKTGCRVFDIIDDMSYGRHKNYSLKHAEERFALYNNEGFKIFPKTVNLPPPVEIKS